MIFCISPLMRLIFPDAVRMEKDGQQLLTLMRAYYETTMPWIEVISLEAESDGFGCYTLNMDVTDLRRQQYIGEVNVQMAMRLGKLSVKNDPDHRTAFETGKFYTEKMEDARQTALDVFKQNSYSHNVTFKMLDKYIKIGTPIAIKTKENVILDTYISAIKITKNKFIEYTCGNIRIKFIDKLLKERGK